MPVSTTYIQQVMDPVKQAEFRKTNPDSLLIAITRSSPRFRYDAWIPEPAPSWDLLSSYNNGLIEWKEYDPQYNDEMSDPVCKKLIQMLARIAINRNVVLICFCGPKKGDHCHRFLLKNLVEGAM